MDGSCYLSEEIDSLLIGELYDDELWTQNLAARQRSRYLRFARPPQEQRLIEARTQTMKEANASALVRSALYCTLLLPPTNTAW